MGLSGLRLENVDHAPLTSGQVCLKVRAAGVSSSTTLVIAGKYQRKPPLPFVRLIAIDRRNPHRFHATAPRDPVPLAYIALRIRTGADL
jgi:hypothetical protein